MSVSRARRTPCFSKTSSPSTHRGLRVRVEKGKAGGGRCYGYDVVKRLNGDGEQVRGERKISEAEVEIVRRIFREFSADKRPKAIAADLNRDGIPGLDGKAWGDSTVRVHVCRGPGLVNNERYAGVLVWNRLRSINQQSRERRSQTELDNKALEKVERGRTCMVAAIEDGMYQPAMKARMDEMKHQKADILARMKDVPADMPAIHPNVAEIYRRRVHTWRPRSTIRRCARRQRRRSVRRWMRSS